MKEEGAPDIVLTADRSLMSDYRKREFLGFTACAPSSFLPRVIFDWLFMPKVKCRGDIPIQAPYALRKIEAKLIEEGFNVLTIDPDRIHRYMEKAKVLAISTMDPLGLGPASVTFSDIFKCESRTAYYFRKLLSNKSIRRAKERGLKVIVGGPGAWQLATHPEVSKELGIDCIVIGEGERVIVKLMKDALEGKDLPSLVEVKPQEVPKVEEIPAIRFPSINGLIEVTRGCIRGCDFCSVTLRPLRHMPFSLIEAELKVNVGLGSCILHAEDVLLYGSYDYMPRNDKVIKLHELAKKYSRSVCWSHTSLSTWLVSGSLTKKCSEIVLDDDQRMWAAQVGIETGSVRLVRKYMQNKVKPFKPEQWPDIVEEAIGLMNDVNFIPACTLITGLPDETVDDVIRTIELIERLRKYTYFVIPLHFVPLGKLKDKKGFSFDEDELYAYRLKLGKICLEHDLRIANSIMDIYLHSRSLKFLLPIFKLFVYSIQLKSSLALRRL